MAKFVEADPERLSELINMKVGDSTGGVTGAAVGAAGAASAAMNATTVKVRVDSDVLKVQAGEVRRQIAEFATAWAEIKRLADGTKAYWNGDAADACRKEFSQYDPSIEQMTAELSEIVTKLEQIAQVYEQVEEAVTGSVSPLPSDIIKY